jgi:hypothetical protein
MGFRTWAFLPADVPTRGVSHIHRVWNGRPTLHDQPGNKMTHASGKTSFLCTLPGAAKSMAYSITVGFIRDGEPNCVQFTSFVGEGRRSFRLLASAPDLAAAARGSIEALCRLAIGQVIRDSLHAKTAQGDHTLDMRVQPWEGDLRPAGARHA